MSHCDGVCYIVTECVLCGDGVCRIVTECILCGDGVCRIVIECVLLCGECVLWCGECVLWYGECVRERCRVEECEGGGEELRDSSPVQTLCPYLSCLAASRVGLVMAETGNRREERRG